MANTFKNETFRSGKLIGNILIIGFVAMIVLSVVGIIGSAWMLISPDSRLDLPTGDPIHGGFVLVGLTALFQLVLRLISVVVFLIWLYRVFSNLPVIGARKLGFSPGWAVGWWFVPFLNIVQPYKIVKELYGESQLAAARADSSEKSELATENVGLWWAAFLLSGFILRLSDNLAGPDGTDPSKYLPVTFLTGEILLGIAAVMVIVIIRDVNSWQQKAFTMMQPVHDFPPPPPTFEQQ